MPSDHVEPTDLPRSIDIVVNFQLDDPDVRRPPWSRAFLGGKIGVDESIVNGLSVDQMIAMFDEAGVERGFLIAVRAGAATHPISRRIPYEKVAAVVASHPDRFSGLAGIDPTLGRSGRQEIRELLERPEFVGVHFYPHWFEMRPDDRVMYPYYELCCELGVPIQMQVGHCLRYSAERPLRTMGYPDAVDRIACDFPELKLVGIHVGWPWTEEMIAVAYKHPNVYIGTDAYAPRHLSKRLVHYIDTFGAEKVLFGTDFPVVHPDRAMREVAELNIRPSSMRRFLRDNAIDLYGLSA